MSWREIARDGVEMHWMPGGHREMMLGSHLDILATGLNDCLKGTGSVAGAAAAKDD